MWQVESATTPPNFGPGNSGRDRSEAAESKTRATHGSGFDRSKQCLFVWLFGGPSQLDTFDMKRDAPKEVRGSFRSIPTNVEGIAIFELQPRMARHADKHKIVRRVTHGHAEYFAGLYTMQTGTLYPRPTAAPVSDSLEGERLHAVREDTLCRDLTGPPTTCSGGIAS